jgi:hypothetical protein
LKQGTGSEQKGSSRVRWLKPERGYSAESVDFRI